MFCFPSLSVREQAQHIGCIRKKAHATHSDRDTCNLSAAWRIGLLSLVLCAGCSAIEADGACPLVTMLPFSDGRIVHGPLLADHGVGAWTPQSMGINGFTLMAAAQLAMDHFNDRDPSVVPELADEGIRSCDVTFSNTSIMVNSDFNLATAFDALMDATATCEAFIPCAVIGPGESSAVLGTASITRKLDIPQTAYGSSLSPLTESTHFSNIVRTTAHVEYAAEFFGNFLQRDGHERNFIAVLSDGGEYQSLFTQFVIEKGYILGLMAHHQLMWPEDVEDADFLSEVRRALRKVKQTGFHTVGIAMGRFDLLPTIAAEADALGMLGDDYLWYMLETLVPPRHVTQLEFEVDSPMDKLLRGSGIFAILDGFSWNEHDKFLLSWSNQNKSFVHRLNAMHPLKEERDRLEYFEADDNFFQDQEYFPARGASFVYDSVIAVGIGACRTRAWNDHSASIFGSDAEAPQESSNVHVKEILNSRFHGASGIVSFDDPSKPQDRQGTIFGMYNVRPGLVRMSTGMQSYDAVLAFLSDQRGELQAVEGESFIFADGTTNDPMPLREIENENFLSLSVHIVGLTLMSLSLVISIGSAGWVWWMRRTRIVRAAQPEFLYCLCFGSVLTAASIFPLSFDESYGWSTQQLDAACASIPWLFFLGHLFVYSAIFSKLMRVDKVLQFRRRKVTVRQVLWPFAIFMFCNTVLLTVWSVVDPMHWERELITENPPETYGRCSSDSDGFFFAVVALLVCSTTVTAFMAWKTKDIPEEFSETTWVFYAILVQIQGWFVGVPVLVILDDSSVDASYMGRVMLIWTFAVSMVVLVIWPKMAESLQRKVGGSSAANSRRDTVRISGINNSNGVPRRCTVRVSGFNELSQALPGQGKTESAEPHILGSESPVERADGTRGVRFKGECLNASESAVSVSVYTTSTDDATLIEAQEKLSIVEKEQSILKKNLNTLKKEYSNLEIEHSALEMSSSEKNIELAALRDDNARKEAMVLAMEAKLQEALARVAMLENESS